MLITSDEFDEDTNRALDATSHGPVFITESDKASYVLLSIEDYAKFMKRSGRDIVEFGVTPDTIRSDAEPPLANG